MPAALVGTPVTGENGASDTTVSTGPKSTTDHNSILVGFLGQEGDGVSTISGCTDTAGNLYLPCTQAGAGGGGAIARWFYCHDIIGNPANVCTGTWSNAERYKHAIQIEISGLKNQAPIDQNSDIPFAATLASAALSLGAAVGPIFAIATSTNDRTWSPGSGFTEIADWGTSAAAEYYTTLAATGSVSADMTANLASNLTLAAVAFEQAGGPVIPPIMQHLRQQGIA